LLLAAGELRSEYRILETLATEFTVNADGLAKGLGVTVKANRRMHEQLEIFAEKVQALALNAPRAAPISARGMNRRPTKIERWGVNFTRVNAPAAMLVDDQSLRNDPNLSSIHPPRKLGRF